VVRNSSTPTTAPTPALTVAPRTLSLRRGSGEGGGWGDLWEWVEILPKVREEVEAQNRVEQVVVWILQATLLQNAHRDLREAVWDGEGWGANRRCWRRRKAVLWKFMEVRDKNG